MTNRSNTNGSDKSTIQGAGLFKVEVEGSAGNSWGTFSRSFDKNLVFSVAGDEQGRSGT